MATLSDVVLTHDNTTTCGSLCDNLGDGLLLARNSIYRRVRDRALELGFHFSSNSPLHPRYLSLDALCFDEILDLGIVPYVDNVSPLRHFARRAPDAKLSGPFLGAAIRKNIILYESALAIAHRVIFGDELLRLAARRRGADETVLLACLAEAFASTVEDAAAMAADRGTDAFVLKMNSRFPPDMDVHDAHRSLVLKCGARAVLHAAMAAHLAATLHPTAPCATDSDRRIVRELLGLDAVDEDATVVGFCNRPFSAGSTSTGSTGLGRRATIVEGRLAFLGIDDAASIARTVDVEAALCQQTVSSLASRLIGALFDAHLLSEDDPGAARRSSRPPPSTRRSPLPEAAPPRPASGEFGLFGEPARVEGAQP